MNEPIPADTIRITKEEATSTHVDDMLKRQMSLRGEPGVTRDRRRKWYFQNWLVLALAGAIGAFIAWAMIEPYFDDQLYVQGAISDLKLDDTLTDVVNLGGKAVRLKRDAIGSFQLNGDKIYLLDGVKEIDADGRTGRFNASRLHNGDVIGAYVQFFGGMRDDLALATFVVPTPKPRSTSKAAMRLEQLSAQSHAAALLLFPTVAGLIGLFIGAVDGFICRLPRRAFLAGGVGLLVGFTGGFVCSFLANLAYSPLSELASRQLDAGGLAGAFGFLVQMTGRSLAWGLAGLAMGLGQGIALRSGRLLLYGLIGGIIGGLGGGVLFDPIDLILLGPDKPSAHWSRMIGLTVIGLAVGAMIGLVELLARDAWLRMTQGPLTGKEFLIFKDVMTIGSSPKSDLYLFNDPQVSRQHAMIRAIGDECEIEAKDSTAPVLLNNRPIQRARLRHGDNVTIGRTSFVFQRRKG